MKISKNKKNILISVLLLSSIGIFIYGNFTLAFVGEGVLKGVALTVVGVIAQLIVWICGAILNLVIWAIIKVGNYNNFIKENAIIDAWIIVRDLCNMFFILILLVIAFATILRVENYNMKKLLPKLLIMAVLINFSRMICGIIIDFSQVMMVTFLSAADTTGGGFIDSLGVQYYLDSVQLAKWDGDINLSSTVGGIVMAILFLLISVTVTSVMLSVLIMRVVMLWVYIVLSPIAFLASAFPAGQKYASQWWGEFVKQVITGPVLAFFLWLALYSANNVASSLTSDDRCFGPSEMICTDNFLNFLLAIGMLIGGLTVTSQFGGAAGSMASNAVAKIKSGDTLGMKGIREVTSFGADKLHQKTGVDLNLGRAWKVMQDKRAEMRSERYADGQGAAQKAMAEGGRMHGLLAMTGTPGTAWEQIGSIKGIKQRLMGGKHMKKQRDRIIGTDEKVGELQSLEADRKNVWTQEDKDKRIQELAQKENEYIQTKKEIKFQGLALATAPADKKDEEQAKFDKLISKRDNIKDEMMLMRNEIEGRTKIVTDKSEIENIDKQITDKRHEASKYVPAYDFEARASEQKAVSAKASKISDISDANELLRILQDAIRSKDKNMIKAITKKMTKDGNDNEFLQTLAGDTSHVGLKKLMRGLSDKNNKDLYAGFSEQESMALGSEIAEINKGAHHWGATSAYLMENGRWRETTDQEHNEIRSVETGKLHQQQIARTINRLGYGYHDSSGEFHIDAGGMLLLQKMDNDVGRTQVKGQMNESAAKHLYKALIDSNGNLKDEFKGKISEKLLGAIEERIGNVSTDSFEANYNRVKDIGKRNI